MKIDERWLHRPRPNRENTYRWDVIGGYVVSTIKFSASLSVANEAFYETLVYSCVEGKWDVDGTGVHSMTEAEADAAHVAACDRIRGRIV
jgi:hypothetical protein